MTQFSYTIMAASYISGLTALAGVSITVLALILALDKNRHDLPLLRHIVAALTTATIVCIVTSQMMSKTSAVVTPSGSSVQSELSTTYILTMHKVRSENKASGDDSVILTMKPIPHPFTQANNSDGGVQRLFLLASSGVFIAVALFLFGLILVPVVYKVDGFPQQLAIWTFTFMQTAAWLWQVDMTWREWHNTLYLAALLVVIGVGAIVGLKITKTRPVLPYVGCLIAIAGVVLYYASTMANVRSLLPADVFVYLAATSLAPALLLGSCWTFHNKLARCPTTASERLHKRF